MSKENCKIDSVTISLETYDQLKQIADVVSKDNTNLISYGRYSQGYRLITTEAALIELVKANKELSDELQIYKDVMETSVSKQDIKNMSWWKFRRIKKQI